MYCILFVVSVALTFWQTAHHATNNRFVAYANLLLFSICTTHFAMTFNGFWTVLVSGKYRRRSLKLAANARIAGKHWGGRIRR